MFNWFWEFLYGLIKVPLFCIDIIIMVARKLCGVEPIQIEKVVNGQTVTEDVDLLTYFMQGETILNSFGYVCLFGFILLFLFTAFRVVREQVSFYEKKSPVRICLDSAKILFMFLLVPAIMIVGALFVSTIMSGIVEATSNGNTGLGGSMFVIFSEEAYIGPTEDKTTILDAFRTCSLSDYLKGVNEFSYYNTSKVTEYFQLSKLNFFLGLLGSISVVILLSLTLLSFVERLISLVLLFVIAPLPMSASPLDDGDRFKSWREQVINKFLTAYGGILALNIFSLMFPMIVNMQFFPVSGTLGNVVNGTARLLFLLGGAFACRRGMVLIGNLVSRGTGSQEAADLAHIAGGMAAVAHTAGNAIKSTLGFVGGAAKSGVNTLKSWGQAAGVPVSIADVIRKRIAESQRPKEAQEADRFNVKQDYGRDKNGVSLESAMRGGSQTSAPSVSPSVNTPSGATGTTSPANNEKNSELNKTAQSDIKNALMNKKSNANNDSENKVQ